MQSSQEVSSSHELIETMQLLCTLLGGIPETETRSYRNSTEMIYFEVDDIHSEKIVTIVEKAGLQIFPVVYKQSREDKSSSERDYLIMGLSIPTTELELYTGTTLITGRLIARIIKEAPNEFIFLAIETPTDDEFLIDMLDPDDKNDTVDIFINSYADIIAEYN